MICSTGSLMLLAAGPAIAKDYECRILEDSQNKLLMVTTEEDDDDDNNENNRLRKEASSIPNYYLKKNKK